MKSCANSGRIGYPVQTFPAVKNPPAFAQAGNFVGVGRGGWADPWHEVRWRAGNWLGGFGLDAWAAVWSGGIPAELADGRQIGERWQELVP
jgi:hypothetical protein